MRIPLLDFTEQAIRKFCVNIIIYNILHFYLSRHLLKSAISQLPYTCRASPILSFNATHLSRRHVERRRGSSWPSLALPFLLLIEHSSTRGIQDLAVYCDAQEATGEIKRQTTREKERKRERRKTKKVTVSWMKLCTSVAGGLRDSSPEASVPWRHSILPQSSSPFPPPFLDSLSSLHSLLCVTLYFAPTSLSLFGPRTSAFFFPRTL